jgi:hypothetical protein
MRTDRAFLIAGAFFYPRCCSLAKKPRLRQGFPMTGFLRRRRLLTPRDPSQRGHSTAVMLSLLSIFAAAPFGLSPVWSLHP